MNNMILKEIYRAVLFSKLSSKYPSDFNIEAKSNTYNDIHKIILNNNMSFIENQSFKCYCLKYNNTIYIAIHSTLTYDMKKMTKMKDNIYVNQNLLLQYRDLEIQVIKNINELNKTKLIKKIYICGYHVGGALATLTAAILAEKYKNMFLVSCFTFASPMVGNKHFKKYYNEYVTCNYRLTTSDDTPKCYSRYCHVSGALQLEEDNIIDIEEHRKNMYESFAKRCLAIYDKKCTDSHAHIDTYIVRLKNLVSIIQSNILNKDISLQQLLKKPEPNKETCIHDVVLSSTLYV